MIVAEAKRNSRMASIRSKDTTPERKVREIVAQLGYDHIIHERNLPGTPDIVVPQIKRAIFVNGCFWHQHDRCRFSKVPKSNQAYWIGKLLRNKQRDAENQAELHEMGWETLVIWECQINELESLTKQIHAFLTH